MTTQFNTFKNGKVSKTVFANATTKQIVIANRNSFGCNVRCGIDSEFDKLANNLKKNLGNNRNNGFSYSQRDVESLGFVLVKNGDMPLF
jgi:hypothetical protein